MIRSQNKNFQFLGFFIIICDLLLDLPLPSSSSDFRFKQISLSGQIFFGLVFLGRLFGRVTNFEGANLTRRLTLALFFFLSDDDWRKILFLHILYSQYLTLLKYGLFIAIHIPRRKGDFTGDWLFQTPASKNLELWLKCSDSGVGFGFGLIGYRLG